MQSVTLTVENRDKSGKGVAKALRRNGRIPAVLYGHGGAQPISMDTKSLVHLLNSEGGEHALVTLSFGTGKEKNAVIKDYQVHPVSGKLIHADLQEVAMDEAIKVDVEVLLTGTSKGVKAGGILQHSTRAVAIECVPSLLPEHIDVDISNLDIGDSLRVRDLDLARGIRIHTDGDAVLATVIPPISSAKLEEMISAAPSAAAEPEVVARGKAKEGE